MQPKQSIAFILAIFISQISLAQTEIAVFSGVQFNRFQQDVSDFPEEELNPQIRYHFGARLDRELTKNLSLRTAIALMRKGASLDYEGRDDFSGDWEFVDGYDRFLINYLHLPVQLTYRTGKFSFSAGPYAGIALSARNKYDVDWRITDFSGETRVENYSDDERIEPIFRKVRDEDWEDADGGFIRGLDLGMDLGLSYRLGEFELSVFYSHGFRNIMAKEEGYEDEYNDNILRNQNFGLSLAYIIMKHTQNEDD
jgi:hypothetical protein